MTHQQFIGLFLMYPKKLAELMHYIRDIDEDKNGFITQTEMDDIIKVIFKKDNLKHAFKKTDLLSSREMADVEHIEDISEYNLKPFYINFVATANRILVNHKQFRDHLTKEMKKVKDQKYKEEQDAVINSYTDRVNNKKQNTRPPSELSVIQEKAYSTHDNDATHDVDDDYGNKTNTKDQKRQLSK